MIRSLDDLERGAGWWVEALEAAADETDRAGPLLSVAELSILWGAAPHVIRDLASLSPALMIAPNTGDDETDIVRLAA